MYRCQSNFAMFCYFLANLNHPNLLAYIKSDYYSVCDDYGVNADETWMHGNWFYTTDHGIFGHEVKGYRKVSTRQFYVMDNHTV